MSTVPVRSPLAIASSTVTVLAILTKADARESNTGYAQGGIAAAVGPDDSPELHARDTMAAGDGLCDEGAVRVLVSEGPRYVRELISWGARFAQQAGGGTKSQEVTAGFCFSIM